MARAEFPISDLLDVIAALHVIKDAPFMSACALELIWAARTSRLRRR